MVKAVVGEEAQLKLAEERLTKSGPAAQIGLVIGKLSSSLDRGFIFDLVPTPLNDAGEPACSIVGGANDDRKKGGKGKTQADSSALFIDQDWIAEHARQVGRMLLGGIKVIGIYIWASESSFKNSTITMCQTVKAVAKATPFIDADSDERLLVHICYSPMRWTTRNCSLASNITSSSLRPCDFKMGKILTSLQAFRCTYAFDFRVPICRGDESNITRLADILHHCISLHSKELKCAKALIDGKLAIGDEQVASGGVHDVEFLLPFMQDKFDACSQKDIIGVLVFAGAVCSYAYLTAKEQLSQAMTDIKEDIILSLKSRLDIICDATERGSDDIDGSLEEARDQISAEEPVPLLDLQLQRKNCSLLFPRRVFIPWLANTYVCDYIQPSETVEVLNDHCAELMSIEVPIDPSRILEPESEAPISATTQSFWDILKQHSLSAKPDLSKHEETKSLRSDQKSKNSAGFNMLMPFLVLILSLIVGVVMFSMRSS
nr:protein odr-4 homolog isoform X1 [Ipomoea batatas]GME21611.1 protein odr-4 homolog isoform X1 [Ipomoea batatas]